MSPEDQQSNGAERRAHVRYRVNIKAVAVRSAGHLHPDVPTRVPVTLQDLSQVGVGWHSKETFYRGELVGLHLAKDGGESGVSCVVRVVRVRRISGQYDVGGMFVRVADSKGVQDDKRQGQPADARPATDAEEPTSPEVKASKPTETPEPASTSAE